MEAYLRALTNPKAVALVGVSANIEKLAARPLLYLKNHGFNGKIYPVNPHREIVQGLRAYPSIAAIPDQIDHAFLLVGTDQVLDAFDACAAAGVTVVTVLADGFAEAGPTGNILQKQLEAAAQQAGILLIGPNSMGVVDTRSKFVCTANAAFKADSIKTGRIAVLSQSGSMIGALLSRGQERGMAFSTLVSLGNEAAVDIGAVGQILLEDTGTDSFILFLETVHNPDALAAFARKAASLGKPVVAYVNGQSVEGQALSVSHTGALTGRMTALRAFLKSIGIVQVTQFDALFEAPAVLAKRSEIASRPEISDGRVNDRRRRGNGCGSVEFTRC